MAETYNFHKEKAPSFFNHLMLGGEVKELTKQEGFDPEALSVVLQINGVDVRIADFNDVLSNWATRIEDQIKQDARFAEFDAAVDKRARELIQKKLGNAMEVLQDVEHSLWKLEVPD